LDQDKTNLTLIQLINKKSDGSADFSNFLNNISIPIKSSIFQITLFSIRIAAVKTIEFNNEFHFAVSFTVNNLFLPIKPRKISSNVIAPPPPLVSAAGGGGGGGVTITT